MFLLSDDFLYCRGLLPPHFQQQNSVRSQDRRTGSDETAYQL
jgi:hypothetical protein